MGAEHLGLPGDTMHCTAPRVTGKRDSLETAKQMIKDGTGPSNNMWKQGRQAALQLTA